MCDSAKSPTFSFSFGRKVVHLDRPEGKTHGWIIRTQDVTTLEVTEEAWDRVILAQGVRRSLSLPVQRLTDDSPFSILFSLSLTVIQASPKTSLLRLDSKGY